MLTTLFVALCADVRAVVAGRHVRLLPVLHDSESRDAGAPRRAVRCIEHGHIVFDVQTAVCASPVVRLSSKKRMPRIGGSAATQIAQVVLSRPLAAALVDRLPRHLRELLLVCGLLQTLCLVAILMLPSGAMMWAYAVQVFRNIAFVIYQTWCVLALQQSRMEWLTCVHSVWKALKMQVEHDAEKRTGESFLLFLVQSIMLILEQSRSSMSALGVCRFGGRADSAVRLVAALWHHLCALSLRNALVQLCSLRARGGKRPLCHRPARVRRNDSAKAA